VCGSFGILGERELRRLKDAGMSRYHHNIESSQKFFPHIVSTHSFQDRIDTIHATQQAGLEICAGGIIGLGENEEERVSMALTLAECEVNSVPLNVLIPLPGTPLQQTKALSAHEILRAIALFRLILPQQPLRLAAGRENALADFLSSAFLAGADGLMIGGYLTQRGRFPADDIKFSQEIIRLWTGCKTD